MELWGNRGGVGWVCGVMKELSVYVEEKLYLCSVNKRLLYEISIIRPLIIFLLVVYHSLCVFTGGWVPPQGCRQTMCIGGWGI